MIRHVNTVAWGIMATLGLTAARADAGTEYFPPRTFALEPLPSGRGDISGRLAEEFAGALRKMDEPSLWEKARNNGRLEAYRFLWLPTWGKPVSVRVERSGGRIMLRLVRLDGAAGYDIGKTELDKTVPLDPSQWDRLAAQAEEADFWDMPSRIDVLGTDGASLIVEGVRDGEYHAVYRWTPRPGPYRELCRAMLDLTGTDLGQKHWPAPPPSRAAFRVVVGLVLCLVATLCLYAALWWTIRLRKPRPLKGLEELV